MTNDLQSQEAERVASGGPMSYVYSDLRKHVFTEDGLRMVTAIQRFADRAFKLSGAVSLGALIGAAGGGDSWVMIACVDWLVEEGELREVKQSEPHAGQNRIFVAGPKRS